MSGSRPKPYAAYKWSQIYPKVWRKTKSCNAFYDGDDKRGSIAERCPVYKTKRTNLEKIIRNLDPLAQYDESWRQAPSFTDRTVARSFLRRNTLKSRIAMPKYREDKGKFQETLKDGAEKKKLLESFYRQSLKFAHHLETFHGSTNPITFNIIQGESSSRRSSQLYIETPSSQASMARPPSVQVHSRQSNSQVSSRALSQSRLLNPQAVIPTTRAAAVLAQRHRARIQQAEPTREVVLGQITYDGPEMSYHSQGKSQRSRTSLNSRYQNEDVENCSALVPVNRQNLQVRQANRNEVALRNSFNDSTRSGRQSSASQRRPLLAIQSAASRRASDCESVDSYTTFSNSILGSIIHNTDKDGLLRSFYTHYHIDQYTVDEDERDYPTIKAFAYSSVVEHSIKNPPPNGLRFREYSKADYQKFWPSTKKILREWKESLGPTYYAYDEDAESGYEDDGEEPIGTWNRCVREAKQKAQNHHELRRSYIVSQRSFGGNNSKDHHQSFESVQSEPQVSSFGTVTRTRTTVRTANVPTRVNTSKAIEVVTKKRTGTWASEPSLSTCVKETPDSK